MLQAGRAAQHYMQTQVRSSTPLELVVMLYDGLLRNTATAIEAMARRDIQTRRAAISKSLAILSELQSTLNMDRGGDIAVQLDRLYTWMTDALIDATVRQDPKPLEDVRRIVGPLRDAWQEVATTKASQPESAA